MLTKNLDFADAASYADSDNMATYTPNNDDPAMATNAGWAPIGDETNQFTGSFDGGGFTISNLYVNISSSSDSHLYAGLFGRTGSGSKAQNLGIVDAYVKAEGTSTSEVYAGGLAGWNTGTISNSYATGEVTATGSSHVYAGGLVGWSNGTIENSYATGSATTTGIGSGRVYASGLVGENGSGGIILNSYATGRLQ